jgi:hypothetical protein
MLNYHWHKCDVCVRCWRHHDNCSGSTLAHTCSCGNESWGRYYTPKLSEMKKFVRELRKSGKR